MDNNNIWQSLEKWRGTLFLLASGLILIFTILIGVETFSDSLVPENIFGPAAYTVAFLGLLGLYHQLQDSSTWLARIGAGLATFGVFGGIISTLVSVGLNAGLIPSEPPAWFMVFFVLFGITFILSYLFFGIAVLRTEVLPRLFGGLLLIPPILFPIMIGVSSPNETSIGLFILAGFQTLVHFAIGIVFTLDLESFEQAQLS